MDSVRHLRDGAVAEAQNTTQQSNAAAPSSRITPAPPRVLAARRQMPFLRRAFTKIDDEIHPMHTDLFHRHLNLRGEVETLEQRHVNTAAAAAVQREELDEKINANSADLELLINTNSADLELLNKSFHERVPLLAEKVNENFKKIEDLFNIIPGRHTTA
jgi:hypothetical protein